MLQGCIFKIPGQHTLTYENFRGIKLCNGHVKHYIGYIEIFPRNLICNPKILMVYIYIHTHIYLLCFHLKWCCRLRLTQPFCSPSFFFYLLLGLSHKRVVCIGSFARLDATACRTCSHRVQHMHGLLWRKGTPPVHRKGSVTCA